MLEVCALEKDLCLQLGLKWRLGQPNASIDEWFRQQESRIDDLLRTVMRGVNGERPHLASRFHRQAAHLFVVLVQLKFGPEVRNWHRLELREPRVESMQWAPRFTLVHQWASLICDA